LSPGGEDADEVGPAQDNGDVTGGAEVAKDSMAENEQDAEPDEDTATVANQAQADKADMAQPDDFPAEVVMERPAQAAAVTVPTDALGESPFRLSGETSTVISSTKLIHPLMCLEWIV
jgi:hypothetical protein